MITSLRVDPCPIGADHSYLYFELLAMPMVLHQTSKDSHVTIHFTNELSGIYSQHIEALLPSLGTTLTLDTLSTQLTNILYSAAIVYL